MKSVRAANRKGTLVYGVATNNADYPTNWTDKEGKHRKCPYYEKWLGMLTRVYSAGFIKKHPTYQGVTIHPDWLLFSNFKKWMEHQNWEGRHLDKDLLVPGNKEYGPDTCMFLPSSLNNLLTLRQNHRGDLPLGVSRMTVKGYLYYTASCSFYGKQKRLGYFKTIEEASIKYLEEKNAYIQQLAAEEQDPKISKALQSLLLS